MSNLLEQNNEWIAQSSDCIKNEQETVKIKLDITEENKFNKSDDNEKNFIRQWVTKVTDFSSEYDLVCFICNHK